MALQEDDVTDRPPLDPSPAGATGSPRLRALTIGSVALISLTAFEALAVATVMPAVAADLGGLTLYPLAFGASLATSVVGMAVAVPGRTARARAVRCSPASCSSASPC